MAVVDRVDWSRLARRVGARYERGAIEGSHALRAPAGTTTVHLEVLTSEASASGLAVPDRRLRVRMPYLSTDDFRIHVQPKGTLARWLKLEDVETGDPEFDEAFQVICSDVAGAERLLGSGAGYRVAPSSGARLRRRFLAHPWLELRIAEPRGWPDEIRFAPRTLQASFETIDLTLGTERNLVAVVELFRDLLEALCDLGSAEDRAPILAEDVELNR